MNNGMEKEHRKEDEKIAVQPTQDLLQQYCGNYTTEMGFSCMLSVDPSAAWLQAKLRCEW